MRFAKYGMRELKIYGTASGALMLVVLVLSLKFIALKSLALLIALPFAAVFVLVVSFFRDPERVPPRGEHRVLAPADGTVYDIGEVDEDVYLGEKAVRVGIFLSIFDCHVNRAPCSGTVEKVVYRKGRFVSALRANECSRRNESNFVGIGNAAGRGVKVGVKQIAGQIARRIVCELKEGDEVERGQAFGMIKFGSRAELFIPASARFKVKVKLGAAVFAGRTVIGMFEDEKAGPDKEAGADEAAELVEEASAGEKAGPDAGPAPDAVAESAEDEG